MLSIEALKHMDSSASHVLYPTIFLRRSPQTKVEAALYKSYNRWMAMWEKAAAGARPCSFRR